MGMRGDKRNREIRGHKGRDQRREGETDSPGHEQCCRRGQRRQRGVSKPQTGKRQHGDAKRRHEGQNQGEMTKFGDHRGGSLAGERRQFHINITGACFEQTTRDISLTSVDGTHARNPRMRVTGRVAHVAICHQKYVGWPQRLAPTIDHDAARVLFGYMPSLFRAYSGRISGVGRRVWCRNEVNLA